MSPRTRRRRQVAVLLRRRAYLAELLKSGDSTLSFDRAEAGALRWALPILEEAAEGEIRQLGPRELRALADTMGPLDAVTVIVSERLCAPSAASSATASP